MQSFAPMIYGFIEQITAKNRFVAASPRQGLLTMKQLVAWLGLLLFLSLPTFSAAQIVCDGTTDNAPYLNSLTLTGGDLLFPPGCVAALKSTWSIMNQQSFTIDGQVRCGLPGSCPRLKWIGPSGGTILALENVQGALVQDLVFDGAGSAANGVVIDQTSSYSVATFDVILQGNDFDGNYPGSYPANSNWVGLSISPNSKVNVADIRAVDNAFACRGTGSDRSTGTGTIGVGIGLTNASQNALQEVIRHNTFLGCSYGIWQKSGAAIIEENTFGGNANAIDDIRIDGSPAGQERIAANWSESNTGENNQFLKIDTAPGATIEISANQIPVNGGCAVDIGGNHIFSSQPNRWYPGAGGSGPKACSTTNSADFTWAGPSGLSWPRDITSSAPGIQAGVFYNGGPSLAGRNESWPKVEVFSSAAAIVFGSPVKWTGTGMMIGTTTSDAGKPGIVVGVAANAPGAPNRNTAVAKAGWIPMRSPGACSVGQFAVVSSSSNSQVDCTSSYTAGEIVGVVLLGNSGSGTVYVDVGLR